MVRILLSVIATLLLAPAAGGALVGTVRDEETDAPIAGATVLVTDLDRAVATDTLGHYSLDRIPAGPHRVTFQAIGHAPRMLHAFVPREGRLRINVLLRAEPIRLRMIDVRSPLSWRGLEADEPVLYPDRSTSIAAARNNPLSAEPDPFAALGGGEVVLEPETPGGVHVRGGAAEQTAYLLDGIPVFHPRHAAGVFSAWNPDALSCVQLSSTAPGAAYPDALSGAMVAETQKPGDRFHAQGSVSTTQERLTVRGPIRLGGAGYLLSLRRGIPGLAFAKRGLSQIAGTSGDGVAKVEATILGGSLRLLGYESADAIDASAAVDSFGVSGGAAPPVNTFEWRGRSFGAGWNRALSRSTMRIQWWRSEGKAGSDWAAQSRPLHVSAWRRDHGLLASFEHGRASATTTIGIRVESSATSYRVRPPSSVGSPWRIGGRMVVAAPLVQHARNLGRRFALDLGSSLPDFRGKLYLTPRARLRWQPGRTLDLSCSVSQRRQFAQSLRNPESVASAVFPADLFVVAGVQGVPVARSRQGVLALECRPLGGMHLGVQGYLRDFDNLLLIAPREGEPFATDGFDVGSGAARGLSIDAAFASARFAALASYGFQHLRFSDGRSRYVPDHGAAHSIEGGLSVFPTSTTSLQLGLVAAFGRRATPLSGGFEWEACNLLDRGCEFAGSPAADEGRLGDAKLPSYFRIDLGLRKNWSFRVSGRKGTVALFGTVTNLLGRRNVLTYAKDPSTGRLIGVAMRPRAPLVLGLDWKL